MSRGRKYFTIIPNVIINKLKLNPYEKVLYMQYKCVAGEDGACFMSNESLAEACGMSSRQVRYVKKELEKPRDELNGKSLISIQKRTREDGGDMTDCVVVNDICPENCNCIAEDNGMHEIHEQQNIPGGVEQYAIQSGGGGVEQSAPKQEKGDIA